MAGWIIPLLSMLSSNNDKNPPPTFAAPTFGALGNQAKYQGPQSGGGAGGFMGLADKLKGIGPKTKSLKPQDWSSSASDEYANLDTYGGGW